MSDTPEKQGTSPGPGVDLSDLRERIDDLDERILELLNERAEVSLEVGRRKQHSEEPIFKPGREKQVMARLMVLNPGPLPDRHLFAVYREIMSSSRRLQRPERVVYLGPEGTFSYFAGIEFMGHSAELNPKPNFHEIFRSVADGQAELGIIPLENSLEGTVGQSVDLFFRYPVYIQAEVYMRISHALMSRAGSFADIRRVCSHSQPLGQCAEWLMSELPHAERVSAPSTAAAARMAQDDPACAVIGHVRLAEMFGLNVLAEHIEDLPDNWTRFFVIGPRPNAEEGSDKSSILFTVPDRPGSLADILKLFAASGVNMSKLESRPFREEKWKYVFFADLECDLSDPRHAPLLEALRHQCHTLRELGSYPAGPQLEDI
ncbi:MAG: prephenate dehydratase [Desulfovibrionaceae bacterium]